MGCVLAEIRIVPNQKHVGMSYETLETVGLAFKALSLLPGLPEMRVVSLKFFECTYLSEAVIALETRLTTKLVPLSANKPFHPLGSILPSRTHADAAASPKAYVS